MVDQLRAPSEAEVAAYAADGVVRLPGILDAAAVAAMAGPVERALASAATADLGAMAGEDGARFAGGVDHWRHDADFRAFATTGALPAIAAALMGSRHVWLYEDSVLVKEPGSPHRTHFHTDAGYFHIRGDQACTFWVPLDPATPETGAVQYVRGSHRRDSDYRPHLFTDPTPLPGTAGEVVPDVLANPELRALLVSFAVEPGDVVVHHYRTLHGAAGNSSSTTRRRAISVRYCGDDVRYHLRDGVPRKPHHHAVQDGDPLGGPDAPLVHPPSR